MTEMLELELLQQLKEEFKALEMMFNKGIDRMLGILRETRKDPEDTPFEANSGSDPESPIKPIPNQNQSTKAIILNTEPSTILSNKLPKHSKPNNKTTQEQAIPRTSSTTQTTVAEGKNLKLTKSRKAYHIQILVISKLED
ncbi:hypothetical protein Ddye_025874 [Dipteronia dyeriana]|uniref:Uncharacterized protein n=1 Tax=Dipteronia dyeriana TaxID=168575 RepID=A0AAD9TL27_9ROSI|nr:hypothetical protein Ddye_025874 [Dipteronia dyeriana]